MRLAKMMRFQTRILFLAVSLTACIFFNGCGVAAQANAHKLAASSKPSDWGPPPPADYKEQIASFFKNHLKDPESARYDFMPPMRDVIQKGFASPNVMRAWLTPVKVNAKNSFGGYTGFETYSFAWKDGKMIAFFKPEITPEGLNLSHWVFL
jgi:hypothetical protein